MNNQKKYEEAIEANIKVHSTMAREYNKVEPHFRPESIQRVSEIIDNINQSYPINKALDLGCGTGFMINILKMYADEITGVDVTQAMMDVVDVSGKARVELINADTGSVSLKREYYDIATAYTFLDHLYDMMPTFLNTFSSLKKGGKFYADLSPNYYFWNEIKKLDPLANYDPIIEREIKAVNAKDVEIEQQFGVDKDIFRAAEHQKHALGGLKEELLRQQLSDVGFTNVKFIYHWYVGQAELINSETLPKEILLQHAQTMHSYLAKSLPLSRHLFKYIGFIATK